MKKLVLCLLVITFFFAPNMVNGQQNKKEKYEPVSSSEFDVDMQFSGRVDWDKAGLAIGGPVERLSFWGHNIELTSNMIKEGLISTKDYGNILIRMGPNFTFETELTPTQQRKLKNSKISVIISRIKILSV